jgi:chemotaxis protein histidine kinase CheA
MSSNNKHSEVTATAPDYALKKKLEDVSIRDVFTEDSIQAAESLIEEKKNNFFDDTAKTIKEMEASFEAIKQDSDVKKHAKRLEYDAHSLKAQAETLGFDLLAHAANSLYVFCEKHFKTNQANQFVVIQKHLETLDLIIRDEMKGDGGELGAELVSSLHKLSAKYAG